MKKLTLMALILFLLIAQTPTKLYASSWEHYFGMDEKCGNVWYEGAECDGEPIITNTDWKAKLKTIGWGGIWGAQMKKNIYVKKGKKYQLKCTLKSSNCDKWVFIKIATDQAFAYGKWIRLKKGKSTKINEIFKAKATANYITFGFGGEFGDRESTGGLKDYKYADGGIKSIAAQTDKDPTYATTVTCSGFSLKQHTLKSTTSKFGKKMALKEAKNYLKIMPFSKKGLMEQLKFEGYSDKEAEYAVKHCKANWKKQGVRMAKSYLKIMPFSKKGLTKQLLYEKFTKKQAKYGVKKAGYK